LYLTVAHIEYQSSKPLLPLIREASDAPKMSQESIWVGFNKDEVPEPLDDCRLIENLALCDVIFFVNRAAWQYYLVIVCAQFAELTVFDVFLVGDP
jgi:hypothetical protein